MDHHAFRNFLKHESGDLHSGGLQNKNTKREARSASPPALHKPTGGNRTPCFPKYCETRAGRQQAGGFQRIAKLEARSAAPPTLYVLAGGNGPSRFPAFSKVRVDSEFYFSNFW